MIREKKIFRFAAILVLFSLLFPIGARNLPLIDRSWVSMAIWFILAIFLKPRIFINTTMLWIYISMLLALFNANLFWDIKNISEVSKDIILHFSWIALAVSMNVYFLTSKDIIGYRIVIITALIFIIISSITSIIGLNEFPNASRSMAAGIESDANIFHTMYNKIGIVGYGFYAMTAFLLVVFGFYINTKDSKITKLFMNIFVLVFIYSNYLAQHTTILLFAIVGFTLSKLNLHRYLMLKILSIIILFAIFKISLPPFLYDIANSLPQDSSVSIRLMDISNLLENLNFDTTTSDSYFVTERLGRTEQSLNYFLDNIIIGSGKSSGHAYWLDMLAKYGLSVFIPYIMIFIHSIRFNYKSFTNRFKPYYITVVFLMIAFGIIKNMESTEIWMGFFFIVPGIFYLSNTKALYKTSINIKL